MRKDARLPVILQRLSEGGSASIEELARALDVSTSTIRRDLNELEEQRLLNRTHGGAVAGSVSYELPLRYRGERQSEQKRRIGRAVAALVPPGATVGISGGTTTTEAARVLAAQNSVTIVTNSLNIATEVAIRPNVRLFVTGGMARSASFELVGPVAERTLSDYNLDLALLGVDGIDLVAGCTTHDTVEAKTNSTLIGRAAKCIVLADSSKLGRVTFAHICDLDAVDTLITDADADEEIVASFRKAGLTVDEV
jgi:DeoR family transcriptional regulator, aga operon transcriptional repressor